MFKTIHGKTLNINEENRMLQSSTFADDYDLSIVREQMHPMQLVHRRCAFVGTISVPNSPVRKIGCVRYYTNTCESRERERGRNKDGDEMRGLTSISMKSGRFRSNRKRLRSSRVCHTYPYVWRARVIDCTREKAARET